MRIGVYNRYWSTGGGGERYAGAIARALVDKHDVDLLAVDGLDVAWLTERLSLDLDGIGTRMLEDAAGAVHRASEDYDLFVNACYASSDSNGAARGIYVVHFPSPPVMAENGTGSGQISYGDGFYPRENGRVGVSWTNGQASLFVAVPPGETVPVELVFAHCRPAALGPAPVRITVDDAVVAEARLKPAGRLGARRTTAVRVEATGRQSGAPVEIGISSDAFRPDETTGSSDSRVLGVALRSVRVGGGGHRWRSSPAPAGGPVSPEWLRSYDALVTNSSFSQSWIRRWWGLDSQVLHPPPRRARPGPKDQTVLAVGRFFPPERGHCKRQLEMVGAFRRMCERGLQGWSLHLVGGCKRDEADYMAHVRRAAAGLPIQFHIDAGGAELGDLFTRASIYWHATGLGDDIERHPERFEHFGIATVEAMAAGAVPVVIGHAGPAEVVDHGRNGYHFHTIEELTAHTQRLVADEGLRRRMSAAAMERSLDFADGPFADRLRRIVDDVMSTSL